MAWTHVASRGRSPNGSKACRQRTARNTCASTPNGMDSHIHVQSIPPSNAVHNPFQSKSRYIHHRINPPNTSGKAIFNAFRIILEVSNAAYPCFILSLHPQK